MIKFDHFVLGVPDLENARKEFAAKSRVMPALGGQHPAIGTHNALVSLGGESYLEFLAIDNSLARTDHPLYKTLQKLTAPAFVGWAIQADAFEEVAAALTPTRFRLSKPGSGRRLTAEGVPLEYQFVDIKGPPSLSSLAPFVVSWIDSIHPALMAPTGCSLSQFSMTSRPSEDLEQFLGVLGLPVKLVAGNENRLYLEVRTPAGLLKLG